MIFAGSALALAPIWFLAEPKFPQPCQRSKSQPLIFSFFTFIPLDFCVSSSPLKRPFFGIGHPQILGFSSLCRALRKMASNCRWCCRVRWVLSPLREGLSRALYFKQVEAYKNCGETEGSTPGEKRLMDPSENHE